MQTYKAETKEWAIAHGRGAAAFIDLAIGQEVSTGQPELEVYSDKQAAITRMLDLAPDWEPPEEPTAEERAEKAHSRLRAIASDLSRIDQRHGDRAVREFMLSTDLHASARERIESAEAEAAELRDERGTLVSEYGEPDAQ